MRRSLSRRNFIGSAATAGVGVSLATTANSVPAPEPVAAGSIAPTARAAVEWPVWDARDQAALIEVLNSGKWGRAAGGKRVSEFEAAFAEKMRARYCLATSSGTTALLTTFGALGIGPGDEVILPPYTFVATFNAITNSYALPVFVDSDAETFQIDPTKIAAAITPSTKLLLPVHIGGSPADLDAITTVAKSHNVTVIEEACQAPLAEWRGQPVGNIGLAGCFSFQSSKNLTSGEGGAIVTNDEAFANLCYNFHTPSGNKPGLSSGRASNFRLTEFQAGLLISQLTRLEEQAKTREANAARLTELLRNIPGISPARLASGCTRSAYHLYMLRYDPRQFENLPRAKFLKLLAKAGIAASGGYTSLNNSLHVKALANNRHYRRLYGTDTMDRWVERNQCPVNDRLCEEAVWLSQSKLLHPQADMDRIATVIADIQKRAGDLVRSE
jgi:dTDP-4-amino-4,6-dideoxygalactose transaminase